MNIHRKKWIKRILPILGAGGIVLASLSPGYGGEWEPMIPDVVLGTVEIKIKNLEFTNPNDNKLTHHILVIPEGVKVKWINMDPLETVEDGSGLMPHGIKIVDVREKVIAASPILNKVHDNFSHTFGEEGTYTFKCFIHPSMTAKIVVIAPHHPGS